MQPLNPFLKAFFASKLPAQCSPSSHYVLLVPPTEFLLSAIDAETHSPFADLVQFEDFLSSHVIRISGGLNPVSNGQSWPNLRDTKTKVKQYTTLNGRTLIIKDALVYTNKGFKHLNQAQILGDHLYYADAPDSPQWLLYSISKPLLGSPEVAATAQANGAHPDSKAEPGSSSNGMKKKKDINSFQELFDQFPMISRQMQPGLEKLFKQFSLDMDNPLPAAPSVSSSATTLNGDGEEQLARISSASTTETQTSVKRMSTGAALPAGGSDPHLTRSLETLVISAIDLFQSVDKQQLAMVADATNLSGPIIERMIERYMLEQVHESQLFPRICSAHQMADQALESHTKYIADVDVSQVGISDYGTLQDKRLLLTRILAGVDIFKKMNQAKSPQEMVDILLKTEQAITSGSNIDNKNESISVSEPPPEKSEPLAAMNADTLVSLLLMVVVRSQVRQLHARLAYMRDFVFIGDVESGQIGYALSTFEAVLLYISSNTAALRKIGKTNRLLWQSLKNGNKPEVRSLLDPDAIVDSADAENYENGASGPDFSRKDSTASDKSVDFVSDANGHLDQPSSPDDGLGASSNQDDFPSQVKSALARETHSTKVKKRVSMDMQSVSSSSDHSLHSRSSTVSSLPAILSGETSADQLAQTHDPSGNSIFMMAVEDLQPKMLSYLFQLSHIVSPTQVWEDRSLQGVTLLSAAVQLGDKTMVGIILDYILDHVDNDGTLQTYLYAQDVWGRSVAHYCFNVPYLITSIGHLLPWTQKDRNGQTPLFAMCRSYDHEDYRGLVESAISAAGMSQHDSPRLNLDDHVDNKGNSLLHVANDPKITKLLLFGCSSDPNAFNEKRFTPLMVATKFARTDSIRIFFNDPRIDLQARDLRGLTAVEVAKDDEIRNRIDDLVLLLANPIKTGRATTIVRSFFVEDGSVRMLLKSGAVNGTESITVTTCRRSLADFENLAKWLAQEHPASWVPDISNFRSPFQISNRPSKQVLRDIQLRLDQFLQTLLDHPTFGTHELVWEFFLVPEFDQKLLSDRTKRKAETRVENLKEDYDPLLEPSEITEVEVFTGHALGQIRHVHNTLRTFLRYINNFRNISTDLAEANRLTSQQLSALAPQHVPVLQAQAYARYASSLTQREYSPHIAFHYAIQSSLSCSNALLSSLARPTSLIGSINSHKATLERYRTSSQRSQRWPSALGLLDDARTRIRSDAESKVDKTERELDMLGRELRYTRAAVAGDLAGWHEGHAKALHEALRTFAQGMVVVEKERLEAMRRAVRSFSKPLSMASSKKK